MKYLDVHESGPTFFGLANGPIVATVIDQHPDCVDYVEIAFEQLRHHPPTALLQEQIPVVLHCSSMSVAGFSAPTEATLSAIDGHAQRTRTPWIGEHLAYIAALPLDDEAGTAELTELTYTVCPQLSEETVERVALNLDRLRSRFSVPIILENSPQYYPVPGSTMSMPAFVAEVAASCDVDLLLDLTHFLITTANMGLDPLPSLHQLPLERVVEVHLSGMSKQSGHWWDDHSVPASEEVFELLSSARDRVNPRAVTFEYNWAPSMPESVVLSQIQRAREILIG
ncbi:MAG: uncharacterized protein QOI99_578 [Actinomycetota bacterium]|jgi:uncharacterized protein (UPF0276 family)|nr:uncharacterized protein [Actinomycetota bacterium]